MKRSRGRSRKSGNQLSRQMDSNGPDVKIRGTASHIFEKYQSLARDAGSAGDRIMAENYLQHAEHYYRVVRAANGTVAKDNMGKEAEGGEEDGDMDTVSADVESQANEIADVQADSGDKNNAQKARTRKPAVKADDDGDAGSGRRRGRRRTANGSSGNGKGIAANGHGDAGHGNADSPSGAESDGAAGPDTAEDGVMSPVASNDVSSNDVSSDNEAVA